MEVMSNKFMSSDNKREEIEEGEGEQVMAPGFRFHPTDEELVGFYLQRKVKKKPLRIELIKQIDIYRYHPWDLPIGSNNGVEGEREGYFFCKRGRKYRNSKRPNRVTVSGSGFWKATGIDKPIYGEEGTQNGVVIGLKKSLVYYEGNAGKASKTDWMMHEFRLPPPKSNTNTLDHHLLHEAEVWTLCKIFKRTSSQKKHTHAAAVKPSPAHSTPESGNLRSDINGNSCLTFQNPLIFQQNEERRHIWNNIEEVKHERNNLWNPLAEASPSMVSYYPSFWDPGLGVMEENAIANGNWDELQPMVPLAMDDPSKFMMNAQNYIYNDV